MKKFIVLESIFEEKLHRISTPFNRCILLMLLRILSFVNNIVGSNAVDNSVENPIGSLAKPHILSGNRPVISTDLMQELIGNKSVSIDILKNVKDLTSEDSRVVFLMKIPCWDPWMLFPRMMLKTLKAMKQKCASQG